MKNNILKYLQDNRDAYVSGSYISSQLGISRAAVWKQIRALRRAGYRINSRSNRGYCLLEEPDRLDVKGLKDRKIIYFQAVDSTNSAVRRLVEESCPGYTTVAAEEQLKGRGRLGRKWFSPPGSGLWFSILLRPAQISPAAAAPVTLVTAAALAKNLRENYGLPVGVKWPNDLLLSGKKFGGILSEIKGEPDQIEYLIIGIGLNINQKQEDFPRELENRATSLLVESGRYLNRTELLLSLHDDLVRAYDQFFKEGFAPFRGPLLDYNTFIGQEISVRWPGGLRKGLALDLAADGALLLKDIQGEIHTISYGEII